jgi:hypothetical protein
MAGEPSCYWRVSHRTAPGRRSLRLSFAVNLGPRHCRTWGCQAVFLAAARKTKMRVCWGWRMTLRPHRADRPWLPAADIGKGCDGLREPAQLNRASWLNHSWPPGSKGLEQALSPPGHSLHRPGRLPNGPGPDRPDHPRGPTRAQTAPLRESSRSTVWSKPTCRPRITTRRPM